MTKKGWILLGSVLLAILLALGILVFIDSYYKEQEMISEGYYQQNAAFTISGKFAYHPSDLDAYCYYGYDKVHLPNMLYAYLQLYARDTRNELTMEEIQAYLSQEYNDDGTLRLLSQYPDIQNSVNFIWGAFYQKVEDKPNYLAQYEISLLYGRDALPAPYSTMGLSELPSVQMKNVVKMSLNISEEQQTQGDYFNLDD